MIIDKSPPAPILLSDRRKQDKAIRARAKADERHREQINKRKASFWLTHLPLFILGTAAIVFILGEL